MHAIVQDGYGPPDVLRLEEIDVPAVRDDTVLIRVRSSAVGAAVWHLMSGLPYLVRISGYGLRRPRIRVPGTDVAGHVEAVGGNVTRFRPGDAVFGECEGAFAEYAVAREDKLVAKPTDVTFEEAAAVPDSGHTALRAVRDVGEVRVGKKVLVIGAGGGVGSYAVQIAKEMGAEVAGVCGTDKVELVRSLGADEVIDYTREDFADGERRYDVILDTAGRRPLSRLRRALTPRGTLVIVGGEGGGPILGGTHRQMGALLLSPFIGQSLRTFVSIPSLEGLEFLRDLLEGGRLRSVIAATYPLNEVPRAIERWMAGHTGGKIVITV